MYIMQGSGLGLGREAKHTVIVLTCYFQSDNRSGPFSLPQTPLSPVHVHCAVLFFIYLFFFYIIIYAVAKVTHNSIMLIQDMQPMDSGKED